MVARAVVQLQPAEANLGLLVELVLWPCSMTDMSMVMCLPLAQQPDLLMASCPCLWSDARLQQMRRASLVMRPVLAGKCTQWPRLSQTMLNPTGRAMRHMHKTVPARHTASYLQQRKSG